MQIEFIISSLLTNWPLLAIALSIVVVLMQWQNKIQNHERRIKELEVDLRDNIKSLEAIIRENHNTIMNYLMDGKR